MKRILDGIAARSAEHMRRESVVQRYVDVRAEKIMLLPLGMIVVFFLRFFGTPLSALMTIGLGVLPYVWFVAVESIEVALRRKPSRGESLGRADAELSTHDRLRTADEFLAREHRDGFMDAAIADAEPHLADAIRLKFEERVRKPEPVGPLAPTAAFVVLLCALVLPRPAADAANATYATEARLPAMTAGQTKSTRVPERNQNNPVRVESKAPPPSGASPRQESAEVAGTRMDARRGSPATGRTARTGGSGSQARSADATGAPSAAGRAAAQPMKTPTKESQKKNRPRRVTTPAKPRKTPEQDSGATTGSARSSGASKNPTASAWKTRDTPPDQLEEPEADDQEVEDESEDSESRGGVQPNLRSRKPPVNRDLGIGFGNRASQRSNGRGGASPRKKSRGTASLVLGVPVPDHIKGQPNPGMTKVTRERGEPEREQASAVTAGNRKPRADAIGALPRATLSPWMKEMIRRYFRDDAPAGKEEKNDE